MKWNKEKLMHNMPVDAQPKIERLQALEAAVRKCFSK